MSVSLAVSRKANSLFDAFRELGAQPVETDVLQPAEVLLDLYGEMIRARAYITEDPVRGEVVLRPDFTVPVVNLHMRDGAEPARYTYQGLVFRTQDAQSERPSEYMQVGYEVFDRTDPSASDAEVFVQLNRALSPLQTHAVIGDIGILKAAIDALQSSPERRAALMRHIWRPERFDRLLTRYSQDPQPYQRRESDAPAIGLRTNSEIEARVETLENEGRQPALDANRVDALRALLNIKCPLREASVELMKIAKTLPGIEGAIARFDARLKALVDMGATAENVTYQASYGRTSLEYYDGFVFGVYTDGRPDWPPIASGGRYDALTKVLGQGRSIPAVGGVIRPELLVELEGTS